MSPNPWSSGSSAGNKKTSRRGTGGQRGEDLVALVDNDAAVLHAMESATAVREVVRRSAIRAVSPPAAYPAGGGTASSLNCTIVTGPWRSSSHSPLRGPDHRNQ